MSDLKDSINKAVDKTKDAISESGHRSVAEGEQAKRDLAGDEMTTGEKAGSVIKQSTNTVQAEVDKAKRESR
ncbi:MAG: hypothetical protein M3Y21_10875 [Candidatus Eremiobacteraeota bacterium]|nr:hypothetical protein [Candidatus Eremiobacteraeota bacterium]